MLCAEKMETGQTTKKNFADEFDTNNYIQSDVKYKIVNLLTYISLPFSYYINKW